MLDGLSWIEAAEINAKSSGEIESVRIKDDIMSYDASLSITSRQQYLLLLNSMEILLRWPHNQKIVVNLYGYNFSRILKEIMESFSIKLDDLIHHWSDVSMAVNISADFMIHCHFTLSVLLNLVHIFSNEDFKPNKPVTSYHFLAHPFTKKFVSQFLSIQYCPEISIQSDCCLDDIFVESRPNVYPSATPTDLLLEIPGQSILGFLNHDFVRVLSSLLRKLLYLSSFVTKTFNHRHVISDNVDLFHFLDNANRFWRANLMIQSELMASLINIVGYESSETCEQFLQCSGSYTLQSVLTMRDIPDTLTDKDILLIHMRSLLCMKLNSCIEHEIRKSRQQSKYDDSLLKSDAIIPYTKWLLSQSHEITRLDVSCPLDVEFHSPKYIPQIMTANIVNKDIEDFTLEYNCKYPKYDIVSLNSISLHNFYSTKIFQDIKDQKSKSSLKLPGDTNDSLVNIDVYNDSVVAYFEVVLIMIRSSSQVSSYSNFISDGISCKKHVLYCVLYTIVSHWSNISECIQAPIFQYHFVLFLKTCMIEYYDISIHIFSVTKLWNLLLLYPTFFLSGQNDINSLFNFVNYQNNDVNKYSLENANGVWYSSFILEKRNVNNTKKNSDSPPPNVDELRSDDEVVSSDDGQLNESFELPKKSLLQNNHKLQFTLQYKYVHDMILDLLLTSIRSILNLFEHHDRLGPSNATIARYFRGKFDEIIEILGSTVIISISQDIIIQVCRFFSNLISIIEEKQVLRSSVWSIVMMDCAELCKNQVVSWKVSDNVDSKSLNWHSRVALLHLMQSIASSRVCLNWIEGFFVSSSFKSPPRNSNNLSFYGPRNLESTSQIVSVSSLGNATNQQQNILSQLGSESVSFSAVSDISEAGSSFSDSDSRIPNASIDSNDLRLDDPVLLKSSSNDLLNMYRGNSMSLPLSPVPAFLRHFAVMRLCLYPNTREVALYLIRLMFHKCAVISYYDEVISNVPMNPTVNSSNSKFESFSSIEDVSVKDKSANKYNIDKPALTEALAHDIIRVSFHILQSSSRNKDINEGKLSAISLLNNFCKLLKSANNSICKNLYCRVFEKYGPITLAHKEFAWKRSYSNVFIELWNAFQESVRYRKCLWTKEIKTELLHQVLIFMSTLLAGNESSKDIFRKVMFLKHKVATPPQVIESSLQLSNYRNKESLDSSGGFSHRTAVPASSMPPHSITGSKISPVTSFNSALLSSDGNSEMSYNYEDIIRIIIYVEKNPSLRTVLLLFEMMFDNAVNFQSNENMSNNSTEYFNLSDDSNILSLITNGVPTFANLSLIPFLISLLPACVDRIQVFILKLFICLIDQKLSQINLFKCTRMNPSFFDVLIDVMPKVSTDLYEYFSKLLKIIGKHSISVSQLKRVFSLMQMKILPLTSALLEALDGMIQPYSGPQYFLFLNGDESGLLLPPMQKWVATRGYSFSVWFSMNNDSSLSNIQNLPRTSSAAVNKSMCMLSIRQESGIGVDVFVSTDVNRSSIYPQQFSSGNSSKIVIRTYNGKKDQQIAEVEVSIIERKGRNNILSSADVNDEQWHHLLISHTAASFNLTGKKSEMIISIDGVSHRKTISFPRFSDVILHPVIGTFNPLFKDEFMSQSKDRLHSYCNFQGKLGQIYFFADALTENQSNFVYKLGSSYGQIFNDREASVQSQQHSNQFQFHQESGISVTSNVATSMFDETAINKILDGSLTSSIMLAYNPGVTKDRYLVDMTPEKNTRRWKTLHNSVNQTRSQTVQTNNVSKIVNFSDNDSVNDFNEFDDSLLFQLPANDTGNNNELSFFHSNALRNKGTYCCHSKDMKDSFDSLGGSKVLLPLFSQVDLMQIQPYRSSSTHNISNVSSVYGNSSTTKTHSTVSSSKSNNLCSQILNLFFKTLRNSTVNRNFVFDGGIASLAYVLERISPVHLTLDILNEIITVCDSKEYINFIELKHDIIRFILGNFRLWIPTTFLLQKTLFEQLNFLTASYGTKLLDLIPLQKLIDALSNIYNKSILFDQDSVSNFNQEYSHSSNSEYIQNRARSATMVLQSSLPPLNRAVTESAAVSSKTSTVSVNRRRNSLSSVSSYHDIKVSLTSIEIDEIRQIILQMVYRQVTLSSELFESTFDDILSYIAVESIPNYIIEMLRFLLKFISPHNSNFTDKILTSNLLQKFMYLLCQLHSHPKSAVRLNANICLCSIIHSSICKGKLPSRQLIQEYLLQQQVQVLSIHETYGSSVEYQSAASHSSLYTSSDSARNSINYGKMGLLNKENIRDDSLLSKNESDVFTALGIPVNNLHGFFLYVHSQIMRGMSLEFQNTDQIDHEYEILFQSLQFTMHGLSCKSLVPIIDKIIQNSKTSHTHEGSLISNEVNSLSKIFGATNNNATTYSDDMKVLQMFVYRVSDEETIDLNDVSSMRICISLIFVPLLTLLKHECISQTRRMKLLIQLKISLQMFDNVEAIISIHMWQIYFLDILAMEQDFICKIEEKLFANGWNGDIVNPEYILLNSNNSSTVMSPTTLHNEIVKMRSCKNIQELVINMINDIHLHVIRFGTPMTDIIVQRPQETNITSKMCKMTDKEFLEFYKKGHRNLGSNVINDTICSLRSFGENSDLDIIKIGIELLSKAVSILHNEQEYSIKLKKTSETNVGEIIEIRKKMFEVNMWMITYIISEFVTIPPIQKAKSVKRFNRTNSVDKSLNSPNSDNITNTTKRRSPAISLMSNSIIIPSVKVRPLKQSSQSLNMKKRMSNEGFEVVMSKPSSLSRNDVSANNMESVVDVCVDVNTDKKQTRDLESPNKLLDSSMVALPVDNTLNLETLSKDENIYGFSQTSADNIARLSSSPTSIGSLISNEDSINPNASNTVTNTRRRSSISSVNIEVSLFSDDDDVDSVSLVLDDRLKMNSDNLQLNSTSSDSISSNLSNSSNFSTISSSRNLTSANKATGRCRSQSVSSSISSVTVSADESFTQQWELVESLLNLLGTIDSFGVYQESLMDRLKLGMKVGLLSGINVVSQIHDSIAMIISAPVENSKSIGRDTPLHRAVDNVIWIVLRVLLDIYLQGSQYSHAISENSPHVLAMKRMNSMLNLIKEMQNECYDTQVLYIICRICSKLQYSQQPATSAWSLEGYKFILTFLFPLKSFFIQYILNSMRNSNISISSSEPTSNEQILLLRALTTPSLTSTSSSSLLSSPSVSGKTYNESGKSLMPKILPETSVLKANNSTSTQIPPSSPLNPSHKSISSSNTSQKQQLNAASLLSQLSDFLSSSNIESLKPSDVALETIRIALILPTSVSSSPVKADKVNVTNSVNFSWLIWNKSVESLVAEVKQIEDDTNSSKLTDNGLYKNSQEILKHVGIIRNEETKLIERYTSIVDQNLSTMKLLESKRFQDFQRNEDAFRKKCQYSWNRLLQDIANERGPWGSGVQQSLEVVFILNL